MESTARILAGNSTTSGSGDGDDDGLHAAAIIALVLGGGALVCTLIFVFFYKMCTQKKELETILYFDGVRYWCLWRGEAMATIETAQTLLSYGADVMKEYQSIIDLTSFPNAKDRGRYDTALNMSDEKFPAFSTAGGNRNPHYSRAVHFADKWNKIENRSRSQRNRTTSSTSIEDQENQQLQAALRGYIERFSSNELLGLNEADVLKMLKAVAEQRAVSQWSVPNAAGSADSQENSDITLETAQMMMQVWDRDGNGYTTVSEVTRWFFSTAVLVKPHDTDSERKKRRRSLAKQLVTRARAAMLTYRNDAAAGGMIERVNATASAREGGAAVAASASPNRKKSKSGGTKVIPGALVQPASPRPG